MQTFSVNISQSSEATSYPLPDNFDYILDELVDNDSKLISPRLLRDTMLSLWSSVPFKQTVASSSVSYIGLDSSNPSDRDLKYKILLGKRAYSGTNSYSSSYDIMNSNLLSSDVDLFFYNTKLDSDSNNITKIAMLAGTNISLFTSAPYIQSQVIESTTTQSASLDIYNPSGNVSITSLYGTVSINGITLPTILESTGSASTSKVLKYYNGKMIWDYLSIPSISSIGNTGSSLNITGGVNLNGYPLTFTDTRRVPVQFGDITTGSTFSDFSIVETLRRMVYSYLGPACSISISGVYSSGYVEVGTSPSPLISYTIIKRTNSTLLTGLSNMIPSFYSPITSSGQVVVSGTSSGIVISPISATATQFKITVTDGIQTASASTSLTGVYPYFYGFSGLSTMTTIGLASLSKSVHPKSDDTIYISGSGNLYYIYDSSYGTLSNIYDKDSNIITGSFSSSILVFSSPSGIWAGKQFYVYQWDSVTFGPPTVNFRFEY
jgi:hypothetical protein